MRPVLGDDALAGRSRSNSFGSITTPLARQTQPQMTYFIADEKTMEENLARAPETSASRHLREHMKRSSANYGVESMETISSTVQHDSEDEADQARKRWKQGLMKKRISDDDMLSAYAPSHKSSVNGESHNVSPSVARRRPSHEAPTSHPATPYYLDSPMLGSTPSFLRSRRPSEVDFLTDESQAILSSGDEEVVKSPTTMIPDSSSQFVMPSIAMPTRRPFTEKGKNMGRLKIMVAGDSGVGKTSLIKSIVQTSPDIVHVDPFHNTPMAASQTHRRRASRRSRNEPAPVPSTSKILEVFASTRPYPNWWSEAEEVKVLRRRRSTSTGGDTVLDRNICFVDTPGYSSGASAMNTIKPVIDYIETQYRRTVNAELSDSKLVAMLSGGGGPQVDVVLYLFNKKPRPVDIDYLTSLSHLTNVIPIISQSDTLSEDEFKDLKAQIWSELRIANIRIANLNIDNPSTPSIIYRVSSALSRDDEIMDASILMSPDYKQPLTPSELQALVLQLLDPGIMQYLRHIAAMKCVRSLKSSTSTITGTGESIPLSLPGPGAHYGALQVVRPPIGPTSNYVLARIADHTQREEQLARVSLSNWALDLQRSQANERARFAAMSRHDQAVWHVDALGELVRSGELTNFPQLTSCPDTSSQHQQLLRKEEIDTHHYQMYGKQGQNDDPLGLLRFNEELISKTWAAVQIVSSVGVIGAVAFWVARNWKGDGYSGAMFNIGGLVGDW